MTASALKKLDIPPLGKYSKPTYECKYCRRTFVREHAFMEHECKQMKRAAEFKTPIGQAAWTYYDMWLRVKRRQPPSAETFLTSKYYQTFVNFVKFSNKVSMPQPEKFVRLMVQLDFQPTLWTTDLAYTTYIEYLDQRADPIQQATVSVHTVLNETEKMDVDVSKFFEAIHPNDLIHLVRTRQLSPWFLLLSKEFKRFFNSITIEQQVLLEDLIRPEYWLEKFDKFPNEIIKIKEYIFELGL